MRAIADQDVPPQVVRSPARCVRLAARGRREQQKKQLNAHTHTHTCSADVRSSTARDCVCAHNSCFLAASCFKSSAEASLCSQCVAIAHACVCVGMRGVTSTQQVLSSTWVRHEVHLKVHIRPPNEASPVWGTAWGIRAFFVVSAMASAPLCTVSLSLSLSRTAPIKKHMLNSCYTQNRTH